MALVSGAGCDRLGGPGAANLRQVDDTTLPDSVRAVYYEDAGRLVMRRLQEMQSLALNQIELPAPQVESMYRALARVYNATGLPVRDSVVDLYHIHTFPVPDVRRLTVLLAHGVGWADAWRRGQTLTGNPEVDTLLVRWDLTLDRFFGFTTVDYDLATLHAARPLNMFALGDRFRPIAGVRDASPSSWGGDGNDITAKPDGDAWLLDFSIGYGDCPAGCIGRRTWAFRVGSDGTVAYLGVSGSAPPTRTSP